MCVFNKRPPKPRFTFVWDIEKVLSHLNELRDNLNLPVKLLSQKLALLLALTAAARSSKIDYLNIEYMVKLGHKYIFTFKN